MTVYSIGLALLSWRIVVGRQVFGRHRKDESFLSAWNPFANKRLMQVIASWFNILINGLDISLHRLTIGGPTSKLWLTLTDVKRLSNYTSDFCRQEISSSVEN